MDLQSTNVDPSVLNFTQSVESTHQIEMDDKSNSISVSLFHFVYLLLTLLELVVLATNIKCLLILLQTTIFCITLG